MSELSQEAKRELLARALQARAARQKQQEPEQSDHRTVNGSPGPALRPVPRTGDLQLSFAQERVWFLDRLLPESLIYNVVERFQFTGKLDLEVLRQSIESVVARHEVLRTVYPLINDWPVQRIEKPGHWHLRHVDLRDRPADERAGEARRLMIAEGKTPFDLSAGPVLRTTLYQLADDDYVLAITTHHIAVDGWSLGLLLEELVACYGALVEGRSPSLPRLPVQYADFADWQRRRLEANALSSQRDYWLNQLGKEPPVLDLPTDYPCPAIRTFAADTLFSSIPAELLTKLRALCRQEGVTLFTMLLACFATLIMRYSGQEDFVLGTVIAGRLRSELEKLIGFFANTPSIRIDLSGNPTFQQALALVGKIVAGAYANEEFPFEKVVEEINPERGVTTNPFARVGLNMLNVWNRDELTLPGLRVRAVGGIDLHAATETITLLIGESKDRADLCFLYSTELFKRSTIERLADNFLKALNSVVLNPSERVWTIPITIDDESELNGERPAEESSTQAESKGEPVEQLIRRLKNLGVRFSLESGKLKVNAPKGVIDGSIKNAIAQRRTAILELVAKQAKEGHSTTKPLVSILRNHPLPISAVQRRFWFVEWFEQGRGGHTVGFALRLEGAANSADLIEALRYVVGRHESLRMCFGERDDEPWPEIKATADGCVKLVDLKDVPEADRESEALRLSHEHMEAKFDLANGPLAKFLIIRITPNAHVFVMSLHHIVADGWSASIVVRDFSERFSSLASQKEQVNSPLPIQYVDYAAWEVEQIREGLFDRQASYWKSTLSNAAPLLELPTDRSRPAVQSFRGDRVDRVIDDDVLDGIMSLCKQREVTPFMLILAALQVLLYRISGQEDIVTGTPVANRRFPELENVVGPFVNSVVIRANLEGNPTFKEFLAQVRRNTIDAMDNRELPFELVVESINPTRTTSHAPLFQVLFALHNFPLQPPMIGDLKSSFVVLDTRTARFDLSVDMVLYENTLRASYEFATDLFDRITIERLHDNLMQLLREIVRNDSRRLLDLPILSQSDVLCLQKWNDTSSDYDRGRCVHEIFQKTCMSSPEAIAVAVGDQSFTYRWLDERSNRLAHKLRRSGVSPGARVSICLDRDVDMPTAMLAILKVGAAYVPLDPTHPSERLRYVLEDANSVCVVTQRQFVPLFSEAKASLIVLDEAEAELSQLQTTRPDVAVRPEDLAYIIYTSGSTGRPKGVQVEHRNVVSFLEAMQRQPGMIASDVLLAVTTLAFDIAGLEIWLPLSVGAKVVIVSRDDVLVGERLIALLDRYQVTVMQATPSTWRLMLETGWSGKRDLKILCGGEALPRDLAAKLVGRVSQLWNMYGPTETTVWSTISLIANPSDAVPIGRPILNTRVYIIEQTGNLAPIGAFGELAIAGEGVARGYWNRPELTAEKFVNLNLPGGKIERAYLTGDVVRFRNDGQLEFNGRRDHQIKLRGYRIELGEIELALAEIPGVKQGVVNIRDADSDAQLVAYLVLTPEADFDQESARAALRRKLPAYMVPSKFVVLPSLPLTPNGKIDRKVLPALENSAESSVSASIELLMNPVEQRVADIWRNILKINRVSLHDNFFDVGGHSMLMVKLHGALKREFNSDLALMELFQQTTIASQAERVSSKGASDGALNRAEARARKRLHV